MSAVRIVKLPTPKEASSKPRKGRAFKPPKFWRQGGDHLFRRAQYRGRVFSICPPLDDDDGMWKLYCHWRTGDRNDWRRSLKYRAGCTMGSDGRFPTAEAAMDAVILTCRAIHAGIEVIPFPKDEAPTTRDLHETLADFNRQNLPKIAAFYRDLATFLDRDDLAERLDYSQVNRLVTDARIAQYGLEKVMKLVGVLP